MFEFHYSVKISFKKNLDSPFRVHFGVFLLFLVIIWSISALGMFPNLFCVFSGYFHSPPGSVFSSVTACPEISLSSYV